MATVLDLVSRARVILQDTQDLGAGYRYADTDMEQYGLDAVHTAFRIRPDLAVGSTWDGTASATLPASLNYYHQPLSEWVAATAALRDDQHATEGKAAILLQKMQGAMLGMGV